MEGGREEEENCNFFVIYRVGSSSSWLGGGGGGGGGGGLKVACLVCTLNVCVAIIPMLSQELYTAIFVLIFKWCTLCLYHPPTWVAPPTHLHLHADSAHTHDWLHPPTAGVGRSCEDSGVGGEAQVLCGGPLH